MFDNEAKRVLDRAHRGEDVEELVREQGVDAHPGRLTPELIAEFQAVASSMCDILDEKPALRLSDQLSTAQRFALEALYMAKTAKHLETGEFISGMERGELLNQALMHLQPVVALGLRPDLQDGRPVYHQLVSQVTQTRAEITSAIAVELVPPRRAKPRKNAEQDDTSPDDSDSTGETPAAEAASEADMDRDRDSNDTDTKDTARTRDAEPARDPAKASD